MKKKTTMTGWEIINEIESLEPKNIIDYVLKGSGLNQFMKKHNLGVYKLIKNKNVSKKI